MKKEILGRGILPITQYTPDYNKPGYIPHESEFKLPQLRGLFPSAKKNTRTD